MIDTMIDVRDRSTELVDQFTAELDALVNKHVPTILDNAEYAAVTSALMIALNRELARCAAAFGATHGVLPDQIIDLVGTQFQINYAKCLEALSVSNGRLN